MIRHIGLICAVAIAVVPTQLSAADIFWKGGNFPLTDVNYADANGVDTGVSPLPGDVTNIGAGGTATFDGSALLGKLRVGHALHTANTALNGDGTVTINGGGSLSLTAGASGAASAALWVGQGTANGVLNIDGASVTANQLVMIGYGNDIDRSGTINITNGGSLTITAGNLLMGEKFTGTGNTSGVQGHFMMSGENSFLSVNGTDADLEIGLRTAVSSFTQTGGTTTINDRVQIGQRNSDNSSLNVSGGTFTAGSALSMSSGAGTTNGSKTNNISATFSGTAVVSFGAQELFTANAVSPNGLTNTSLLAGYFDATNTSVTVKDTATLNLSGVTYIGADNALNSSLTVSGNSTVTTGNVVSIGINNALNSSLTVSGDGKLTTGANITIGSNNAAGSSFTISDQAEVTLPQVLTSAGNFFLGRGNTNNTTFTMSGGMLKVGYQFLMGTAASTNGGATNIVAIHSGGTITTGAYFTIADTWGQSTYNLSGSGAINVGAAGNLVVGRRNATGILNQSGGSVTTASSIRVGDSFDTVNNDVSLYATGIYNVSGGTITANTSNQTTNPGLWIGHQGTGTFRVIGDDATININGNMTVYEDTNSHGTLAYQFETGDLLSTIAVTGTATFNAGAKLILDDSLAAPTQTSYNLIDAASIINNGLTFSGPAGWNFQIIDGGLNGKLLQAYLPGDYNHDNAFDAADYVIWRATDENNAQGYTDWASHYGFPAASVPLSIGNAGAVPEPATAGLVVLSLLSLATLRRRVRFTQNN